MRVKDIELGNEVVWHVNEPDGCFKIPCTITKKEDTYALAKSDDGMTLRIDKDTINDFSFV